MRVLYGQLGFANGLQGSAARGLLDLDVMMALDPETFAQELGLEVKQPTQQAQRAQQAQQDQDPSLRGSEVGSPCEPAPQATAFPFVVQDYAPREDSIAGGASVLLAGRQRRT